ncbi:hypothetical protein QYM36_009424, partial [Artemia franciscana]
AFRSSIELIERYLERGIWEWCEQIPTIIEEGDELIQLLTSNSGCIVSLILEGTSQAGTTALAAHIARRTHFPLIQVCTAEEMVELGTTEKGQAIKKEN